MIFATTTIGSQSGEITFTVRNAGQSPTGTPAVDLSDNAHFRISSNGCAAGLAPGATCSVGVRFAPTSVGRKQGVSLRVSADPGGPVVAGVEGTGRARLTVANAGGGRVTSSPVGIDCGTSCTAAFTAEPVTLTAVPDATHSFSGWMGACSGTGACSVSFDAALKTVTANFAVVSMADLSITSLVDTPDPVLIGQTVTYAINMANAGPDAATSVVLTDTLAAAVSLVSATPSQGSCTQSGGTVTCALGTVASGAGATVTIVTTATTTGTIGNVASVTGATFDPVAANNVATTSTTSLCTITIQATVTLSILRTFGLKNPDATE
jgi:uncharacterized repeat protein (TIGR01451 family)